MNQPKIIAFAGSLRAGSFNRKLVAVAAHGAEHAGAVVTRLDINEYDIPLYHGDLESREGLPDAVNALKAEFLRNDGLLVASPEYNGSISGVLKNFIDWTTRPEPGEERCACYKNKVVALMSASPGSLGGVKGLVHTRAVFGNIGCLVLPKQVNLGKAAKAFDDTGQIADHDKQQEVQRLGKDLAELIAKLKGY